MSPTPAKITGRGSRFTETWLPLALWVIAGVVVIAASGMLVWHPPAAQSPAAGIPPTLAAPATDPASGIHLAAFAPDTSLKAVVRQVEGHTTIPERANVDIQKYVVAKGDSVFGIALQFKIKPETLLWANYATLNDNPDMIAPGVELNIPPVDGVYYQIKEGETLADLAGRFDVKLDDILLWPGNHLDMADPKLEPGSFIMAPGGHREFKQWIVPMVWRPKSGTLKNILGPGGCDVTGGAYGSGAFVWPAANNSLSGNDFWSGHRGIDIAAGMGAGIYASDAGAVVYAGPIGGGYGNMVMIDHGNGYQTLYAHLSQVNVRCGVSVSGGQLIGLAGSTGNSTGPHLHFEVRYLGGFINPWNVLP